MDVDKILFRCSSLGHLMKDPKTIKAKEASELAEGVKTHLVDVYVSKRYERFEEITSKFLDKGNATEQNSITIVSRMTKEFYTKNEEFISNDFIQGTPDLYKGESINKATHIRDTKSSYSIFTFHRSINKELSDLYYWQVMGYMALTGATKANVDFCLNNTPQHIVQAELRREGYKHPENDVPNWIALQLIANHVYDRKTFEAMSDFLGYLPIDDNSKAIYDGFVEVPLKERWFTFEVERNDEEIEKLYTRIKQCRKYIKETFLNQ
ncbi:MAG: hypothetical protein RLZZ605_209 [Bacteroidota bacterium]|jgi:hypothetical protein